MEIFALADTLTDFILNTLPFLPQVGITLAKAQGRLPCNFILVACSKTLLPIRSQYRFAEEKG